MKLFQMKANPHGVDRIALFLQDNFICIGWPGIGNLENISRAALEQRLVQVNDKTATDLADLTHQLDEINCFVITMQDGDYVLVAHEQEVYLGDVGDYYYVEQHDNMDEGMCHRRGVTWLNRIPRGKLNTEVQELLNEDGAVTLFDQAVEEAGLERWLPDRLRFADADADADEAKHNAPVLTVSVDHDTLELALGVLKEALHSDDAERRERAAIAILQYAR